MAGRVLIAQLSEDQTAELELLMTAAGCDIIRAGSIEVARKLLHQQPDLLLLDMQLAAAAPTEELNMLAGELELAETLCLRLCPAGSDFAGMRNLAPFACGSITPLGSAEQALEQIETILRIKQAEDGCNRAQERLLLHRMEVEQGLRSAAQIQQTLLPARSLDTNNYSVAWQFIPCETVGGDLFNLFPLSENTLMAYVLDVSGHGVSSAMVTVSVFQTLSDRTSQLVKQPLDQPPYYRIATPAEVLNALDRVYPYERFDKFFTIAYLLLDSVTGRVSYCNGGHPPPILVRRNGTFELLETGGPLIGLGGLLPYEEAEVFLLPGDRLYLYSDGITEYSAVSGAMFGDQRLRDELCLQQQAPLEKAVGGFMETLRAFGGGAAPADDISLFCIQFNGNRKSV